MATFIKPGFWKETKIGYKDWFNLDNLIYKIINEIVPPPPPVYIPPYKEYTALMNQSGTTAPIVSTLFENNLDFDPIFTYVSVGTYRIISSSGFPVKTYCSFTNGNFFYKAERINSSTIEITVRTIAGNPQDNSMANTNLSIRVYN